MRKLLVVAAIAASGYGIWQWQAAPANSSGDNELVRGRLWIDHLPRNEREPAQIFIVLKDHPVGVFNNASMWRGTYEQFRYEMTGNQLRLQFPQTGDRDTARVQASRCKEHGMDFCLQLDGSSRGAKRYFSREGWEVRSLDEASAKLRALE
jgi:hypothetical protein